MGNVNAIRSPARSTKLAAAVLLAGLAGCALPPPPFPELPRLDVATMVSAKNMCGFGVSPPIAIGNAPAATAQYTVRMTNTDVLFAEPWQVTIPAEDGGIAAGSLPDFPAPCLGALDAYTQRPYYRYRFEVLALGPDGRPLAFGMTTVPVYGVERAAQNERDAAERRRSSLETTPRMTPLVRSAPPMDPALVPELLEGPAFGYRR